jgi:uncharacterized protein (TIGR00725 family)
MGSGERADAERAEALGAWLAREGVHLLTGGGAGVMEAVSRGFTREPDRAGIALGVLPGRVDAHGHSPAPGYPNRWVELAVFTHLPLSGAEGSGPMSRNHLNVLSSDVVVALPGSTGTASEVELARRYGRPLVCWLDDRGQISGLPSDVTVVATLEQVQDFVRGALRG